MPALDADPRYGRFGLRTDCPRCGAHLPVNGPVEQVGCPDCGHHVPVPGDLLNDLLRRFEKEFPSPTKGGTVIQGDVTWRWTAEAAEGPGCLKCGALLDGDVLGDASEGTRVRCAACGTSNPVHPLPGRLRGVKTAKRLLGEDDQTRTEEHRDPVALHCPQCGAGLRITQDRERITPCDYCGVQVHLPDAVWRQLHPPREVREWVVRFEGETEAARRARANAEKELRKREEQENKRKKAEIKKKHKDALAARKREQAEAEAEAREANERFRWRVGTAGLLLAWPLTLGAIAVMGVAIAVYFVPDLYGKLGIDGTTGAMLNSSLLAAGAGAFVFAWIWGVVVAAYRSSVPVLGSIGHSLFHVLGSAFPVVGVPVALVFGFWYLTGRMPTPTGDDYGKFRHPFGTTLHLALLLPVAAMFMTVAVALLTDLTIWELMQRMGED